MRLRAPAAVLGAVLLLAACSEEEAPEPLGPVALPENLCDAVPSSAVERWALHEVSHETTDEGEVATATCEMSGTFAGRPVGLQVSLDSYGAADDSAARDDVIERLAQECATLEARAVGTFSDDDHECTDEARDDDARRTTMETLYRSLPARGIARVAMDHHGDGWQIVPAEVVAIAGHLALTAPEELVG